MTSAGIALLESVAPVRANAWRGRAVEFLVVGGATLVFIPLVWLLRRIFGADLSELGVSFTAFYAAHLINDPHFAVTYVLFYKDAKNRAFGRAFSPMQRLRYVLAGIVVPIGLASWGIAFFEGRSVRVFLDPQASIASPVAELVHSYPIRSLNVIAHIRKATQGEMRLENTHPFQRELWGRYWIFAHNGTLGNFSAAVDTPYRPVGATDSEMAFCYLMQTLRASFPAGESPSRLSVRDLIARVSDTDVTVLIRGESGTGKELVARALHDQSLRKDKPFVKVNCAALPLELLESELFGHERGAFTGAHAPRAGKFEFADGGTLMLDEIGEMPPILQAKLLHVLQDHAVTKLGSNRPIPVDVRVIAATNRDLEAEVKAGRFRADLFYRLSVFPLAVPPLRERGGDVPLLATYFVTRLAATLGKRIDAIDDASMAWLSRYSWPGNIRELRNVLERIAILGEGPGEIRAHHLPTELRRGESWAATDEALTLEDVERRHIIRVLEVHRGNRSRTARALGISRATLYEKLDRIVPAGVCLGGAALHHVLCGDGRRRHARRDQIRVRVARVSDAEVTGRRQHAKLSGREDSICEHQIARGGFDRIGRLHRIWRWGGGYASRSFSEHGALQRFPRAIALGDLAYLTRTTKRRIANRNFSVVLGRPATDLRTFSRRPRSAETCLAPSRGTPSSAPRRSTQPRTSVSVRGSRLSTVGPLSIVRTAPATLP